MKRKISGALALIFMLTSAVLSGCNKDEGSESTESSEADVLEATVTEASEAEETETQEETTEAETESETEAETADEEITESEEVTESDNDNDTSEGGEAVGEMSDAELIAEGQAFFETACETDWSFHVGCPYTLDYSSTAENSLGWQFYLITDEGVNSLADVIADYNEVFSESYANDLSEIFLESGGRVYALDGERGADIYYTGSEVVAITERSDSGITFSVENSYSGDDYTGENPYTETVEFSVEILEDGTWRAVQFTLPY
ncbi:MAG: hypothetical protein LIO40_05775 [Ruminococcus sp.]|nr:hypothetical protein [Ruminococcus sp.]